MTFISFNSSHIFCINQRCWARIFGLNDQWIKKVRPLFHRRNASILLRCDRVSNWPDRTSTCLSTGSVSNSNPFAWVSNVYLHSTPLLIARQLDQFETQIQHRTSTCLSAGLVSNSKFGSHLYLLKFKIRIPLLSTPSPLIVSNSNSKSAPLLLLRKTH